MLQLKLVQLVGTAVHCIAAEQVQLVGPAVLQPKQNRYSWLVMEYAGIKPLQLVDAALLQLQQTGAVGYGYCGFALLRTNRADKFSCHGTDVLAAGACQLSLCVEVFTLLYLRTYRNENIYKLLVAVLYHIDGNAVLYSYIFN